MSSSLVGIDCRTGGLYIQFTMEDIAWGAPMVAFKSCFAGGHDHITYSHYFIRSIIHIFNILRSIISSVCSILSVTVRWWIFALYVGYVSLPLLKALLYLQDKQRNDLPRLVLASGLGLHIRSYWKSIVAMSQFRVVAIHLIGRRCVFMKVPEHTMIGEDVQVGSIFECVTTSIQGASCTCQTWMRFSDPKRKGLSVSDMGMSHASADARFGFEWSRQDL